MKDRLDRHITGNYGEDQYPTDLDDEEVFKCPNCGEQTRIEDSVSWPGGLKGCEKCDPHVSGE